MQQAKRDSEGYILDAWGDRDIYYMKAAADRRQLLRDSLPKSHWIAIQRLNRHEQVAILNHVSAIESIIIDSNH